MADFRQLRHEYEKRGWFLVDYEFPQVFVILAAPGLDPPPLVFGLLLDYSNYDARPPSVQVVRPFTREPLRYREIAPALRLNRTMQSGQVDVPGMPAQIHFGVPQALLQAFDEDEIPFLCIAGVREFHDHPAHRGEAWELHRTAGAGRLVRILEVVTRYGVEPIRGYGVNLVPQVGFDVGPPPQ